MIHLYSISDVGHYGPAVIMLAYVEGEERHVILHLDDCPEDDLAALILGASEALALPRKGKNDARR